MALPAIQSAIPRRRYQFGEYIVTVLGDIHSNDAQDYLYLAAVMREGSQAPEVYISCEMITSDTSPAYRVRVLSEQEEYSISTQPHWRDEQKFCDFALQGIQQMFQLDDETPKLLS